MADQIRFFQQAPKRGATMRNSLVQSPYLVRLAGETVTRRIYEDWSQLNKNESSDPRYWDPVPLVLVIKGATVPFDHALPEGQYRTEREQRPKAPKLRK